MSQFLESFYINDETDKIRQHLNSTIDVISQAAKDLHHENVFKDESLMKYCDFLKEKFRKILSLDDLLTSCIDTYKTSHDRIKEICRFIDKHKSGEQDDDCSEKEDEESPSIDELFDFNPSDLAFNEINKEIEREIIHDKRYKEFLKIFDNDDEREEDLQATNVFSIPIDPFTREEVKNPVRNKKCGHIYDRDGVTNYLSTSEKPRCPNIGCNNRKLQMQDIVEDRETLIRIEQLRLQRDRV